MYAYTELLNQIFEEEYGVTDRTLRTLNMPREKLEGREQSDKNAKAGILENAQGYTRLLVQHIPKEDLILCPQADENLGLSDQKELWKNLGKLKEKESKKENAVSAYIFSRDWINN